MDQTQETSTVATEAGAVTAAAENVAAVEFAPGTVGVQKKFNFKARSVKDEQNNVVEKLPKQPSLSVMIPVPTAAKIIEILSQSDTLTVTDEKGETKEVPNAQKQLVTDYINQIIFDQAKSQLDAVIDGFGVDKTKTISAKDLDYDKLSLEYIASIPPARRGATPITDEEWKEFFGEYTLVMTQKCGKTKAQVENHLKIMEKPRNFRAKKDLLSVMLQQLDMFAINTDNMEDFAAPYQRVYETLDRFVKEEDQIDIGAL